jgi:signal transduction histidine kinase/PAS domain-containing protein
VTRRDDGVFPGLVRPAVSMSPDAVASLVARLLKAPAAAVTVTGEDEDLVAAGSGLPASGSAERWRPLISSLGRRVADAADGIAQSADLRYDGLPPEEGDVRSFLGVRITDDQGRPAGSLTVFDTVPRKWTEDDACALRAIGDLFRPAPADRNASFLSALLDSLSVGVLACDASGKIVLLNRALREIHGLPESGGVPADYPSLTTGLLYDADLQPLPWARTPLMRACAGEQVHTDVVTIAPGQRVRTFAVTAQPIAAGSGVSLGAVAVSHEVTALRRAEHFRGCHLNVEHALSSAGSIGEAAPGVLRAVVSALGWNAAELFLIDDSTGDLKAIGHCGAVGREPDEFFGHTPVKGAGITGRVWRTGHHVWVRDIAAVEASSDPFEKERADVCIRNGIRTIVAVPVRDGGTLLGVLTCYAAAPEHHEDLLTVLLDGVAGQIGTYVALRHAEGLARQLERSQDDFISLVGHELRTPLTSISAYASLLADEDGPLDDDCRDMLSGIARNSHDLVEIVGRLLELAGLEAGHLPVEIGRVDLAGIVAEAVDASRAAAAARRIRISTEVPVLEIEGDAHRLGQAVSDLISNAIKFSPVGGTVRVFADRDSHATRIHVADAGIGVAPEERSRVFDRFYRGDDVRHHGTPGSGLGLSRARTIMKLHDGAISLVDNEPGGTIATLSLPHAVGRASPHE